MVHILKEQLMNTEILVIDMKWIIFWTINKDMKVNVTFAIEGTT